MPSERGAVNGLCYAVLSDTGLLRKGNEDSAYAGPNLLAVADGMGGHAAGEVASAAVINALSELGASSSFQIPGVAQPAAWMAGAIGTANERLRQLADADPAIYGMGTTLTAMFWTGSYAVIGHVGDSRCYLLRDGKLSRLTRDHSIVQEMIDCGQITEAEAAVHPLRARLSQALDGYMPVAPDVFTQETRTGDRYLLCSDGLTGVVDDETLRDTLAAVRSPEDCAAQLVALANEGGGPDNITCIVADVADPVTAAPSRRPVLAGAAADSRSRGPAWRTVTTLTAAAQALGYKVAEHGPYPERPSDLNLDIEGYGELLEASFRRHPQTQYWRFAGGFRHVGVTGDKYPTLRAFLAILPPGDIAEFPSVDAFHDDRPDRRYSREADYGTGWYHGPRSPVWRVSYIQATGEVYACCASTGLVKVLGVVPADPAGPGECFYLTLEKVLDGYADPDVTGHQLMWVRRRIAGYQQQAVS